MAGEAPNSKANSNLQSTDAGQSDNAWYIQDQKQLALELKAMGDLHQLTTRLLVAPDLQTALAEILDGVIAVQSY